MELAQTVPELRRRTRVLAELRRRNRILFAVAALHAALLVVFVAGVALDPRTVGGEPAWLKPAKFAASIALLSGTLAWLSEHLPVGGRTMRGVSTGIGAVAVVEIALIATQAARGVASHFNDATLLDATIYRVMGLAITLLFVLVVLLLVLAWRRSMAVTPAFALGIRLGLTVFVLGAAVGFSMIALGQSAVGPGPNAPVLGWALGGDLRVAHFLGMHALQGLPLAGYLAAIGARRGRLGRPELAVWTVGGCSGAVVLVALAHALRPLVA